MTYADASFTIRTRAAHFNYRTHIGKARTCRCFTHIARQSVIVQMRRSAAYVADQEDAVMQTTGMGIGDIGVRAFNAAGKVGGNEQVEDPVNAIGRNALTALLRHQIGNIIGRGGFDEGRQNIENVRAHFGPLLTSLNKCGLRSTGQRFACVVVVVMLSHILIYALSALRAMD